MIILLQSDKRFSKWLCKTGIRNRIGKRGIHQPEITERAVPTDDKQPLDEVNHEAAQKQDTPNTTPEGDVLPPVRHSTRVKKEPVRLTHVQQNLSLPIQEESSEEMHCQAASSDPDTMCLHETQGKPDWNQFEQAMQKEIHDHIDKSKN